MLSDAELKERFKKQFPSSSSDTQLTLAPMRVCPLGAHSDHQLGDVVGFALDKGVRLVFAPRNDDQINLRSLNFEGEQNFTIGNCPQHNAGSWADYCAGTVIVLQKKHALRFGMDALVCSDLPSGGLGSSGAVGVAYLAALARINDITLAPYDLIELDRQIENEYLRVDNGIIDQAITVLGESERLIRVSCRELTHESFARAPSAKIGAKTSTKTGAKILIVYSGIAKQLTQTGFNNRVHECREAAAELLKLEGSSKRDAVLGDISVNDYQLHEKCLPENLRNRARHFFTEADRVARSVEFWQQGDLKSFGHLMRQSGESSIQNYECGAPEIVDLYETMNETAGVLGARFGGGGYRGSGFALIDDEHDAARIANDVLEAYFKRQPAMRNAASVHLCKIGDGAARLAHDA